MNVARQSPRVEEDGTLRWYAGDTFTMTLNFELVDLNDAAINPNPTDKIHVEFKNNKDEVVATFEETGTSRIDIVMNQETSNKFKEGVYSILVKYNGEYVTTLLKNSKVVVE